MSGLLQRDSVGKSLEAGERIRFIAGPCLNRTGRVIILSTADITVLVDIDQKPGGFLVWVGPARWCVKL